MYLIYKTGYLWDCVGQREARMADYRVDVVAGNLADVVECAGGWIFDSVMAGWAVNVVVPKPATLDPSR